MTLLLVPYLLFTFACVQTEDITPNLPVPDVPTSPSEQIFDQLSFLALGDSYTIGTAVSEADRWPVQLAAALEARNSNAADAPEIDVDIVAVNGWTTSNLIAGIEASRRDLRATYDLVSLLIGVNNQYQGRSLAEYETEFADLLSTAIAFAGNDTSRVFVVSIPDYGYTPFGADRPNVSAELEQFNATAKAIATRSNVPFYNITPISQEARADSELVASDNLHPSGKQYRRWVEEVLTDPVWNLLSAD